jgi:hypothetical protein
MSKRKRAEKLVGKVVNLVGFGRLPLLVTGVDFGVPNYRGLGTPALCLVGKALFPAHHGDAIRVYYSDAVHPKVILDPATCPALNDVETLRFLAMAQWLADTLRSVQEDLVLDNDGTLRPSATMIEDARAGIERLGEGPLGVDWYLDDSRDRRSHRHMHEHLLFRTMRALRLGVDVLG